MISCLILNEQAVLFSAGNQRRDYIYIQDLLDLILLSTKKMNALPNGGNFVVVNAGSGEAVSVNEIIRLLEKVSGKELILQRNPASKYWDKYLELFDRRIPLNKIAIENEVNKHTQSCVRKAYDEFGWYTKVTLEKGLLACYNKAKELIKT